MSAAVPALRLEGITRSFPGVLALHEVGLEVAAGSCHALCGENGAGKSTLGRIVAGIYAPDRGTLSVFGRPVRFQGPRDALRAGIAIVHQELAFCENLAVAENLCLGALPARRGFLSRRLLGEQAARMLAVIQAPVDPWRRMAGLTPGQQQMVQIASAVAGGARVIVFDEPTSSLSQSEAERLYELLSRLKADGVTALYVSHRMDEIFRLCDTVTVLRDGRHVATRPADTLDRAELVRMMIGRPLEDYFPSHVKAEPREELLRVAGLSSPGRFRDVSFTV
ncbi:MAG TPA: ATP-binding cassette domain-containing protein, partial [Vicinamibacteria bacterium]|nr:ATP-binding cassette domain-containing protein [Vicinamibacteria bacterium]